MFDIAREPVFCITSDIDWAGPFCVESMLGLLEGFGIEPTLFATHGCPIVKEFSKSHPDDVGIHPNFSFGFAQSDCPSIIDRLLELYPGAKFFRSHGYSDSVYISLELRKRGIHYGSNLSLYLQPNIRPFYSKVTDMTCLPVFWDDSSHRYVSEFGWRFSDVEKFFMTPGLKIIGIHPFLITANIPSEEHYQRIKNRAAVFSNEDKVYGRRGPRSFLLEFIDFVESQGLRFYTLYELYCLYQEGEIDGY